MVSGGSKGIAGGGAPLRRDPPPQRPGRDRATPGYRLGRGSDPSPVATGRKDDGGKGGRAQHFAAAMIPKLFKWSGEVTFAAVASDGHDYLPGIAGAIVTGETNRRMLDMEVPYEQLFAGTQSFEIHRRLGSHLLTVNPTQTNVFDAYIFMRRK